MSIDTILGIIKYNWILLQTWKTAINSKMTTNCNFFIKTNDLILKHTNCFFKFKFDSSSCC